MTKNMCHYSGCSKFFSLFQRIRINLVAILLRGFYNNLSKNTKKIKIGQNLLTLIFPYGKSYM